MSKVTKTTQKPVIELWDTDRTPNGAVYHYITPEMGEDDPASQYVVHDDELVQFILDFEMSEDIQGAEQMLFDAFEDVKDRYWDDVLHPRLTTSYGEAMVYINAWMAGKTMPVAPKDLKALAEHIYRTLDIKITFPGIKERRAA